MSNCVYESNPERVRMEFHLGGNNVAFVFSIPHGRSKQEIKLCVSPERLLQLADIFRGWGPDHWGHAFWHFQRPKESYPCSSCPSDVPPDRRSP